MSIGTVFNNNRTHGVRSLWEVRLPDGVKRIEIRIKDDEHVMTPFGETWDSFFIDGHTVSDDFLTERAGQHQSERESL